MSESKACGKHNSNDTYTRVLQYKLHTLTAQRSYLVNLHIKNIRFQNEQFWVWMCVIYVVEQNVKVSSSYCLPHISLM